MILPAAALGAYLATCAPNSDPRFFASIVSVESTNPRFGFPDSNAIGDNSAHTAYYPANRQSAVALATQLVAQGHNLDLGLAQVNSSNLPGLGRSVADAFNPCVDLQMGERILVGGWNTALAHYGSGAPIFALMDATASEYNSNTLTHSVAYMHHMNDAYNSEYVREVAYGAYLARANAYADAHHFSAAARARVQQDVLAMSQVVGNPEQIVNLQTAFVSPPVAPPSVVATRARRSRLKPQRKAPPHADESFSGVWH